MDKLFIYYPDGHAGHYESGHPERPERVEIIRRALEDAGEWGGATMQTPMIIPEAVLFNVHSTEYIAYLAECCRRSQRLDMDTYVTTESMQLALNAAGGAMAIADAVWSGQGNKGFALTRPPGHHATHQRGMGFCLINNIAVAAEYILQFRGARRLAIIDLDLHHGNGTQDIFYQRGEVFYLSTHQSPYYPGTGMLEETGIGPGVWTNANIPLPPGTGDSAFAEITEGFIIPVLDKFLPEMLFVSFGFDPHWRDPLGHLLLSANQYGNIIKSISRWADLNCSGRIGLFLEGGYDLHAGYACSQAVVAALLGKSFVDPLGASPRPEGSSWRNVFRRAQDLWSI